MSQNDFNIANQGFPATRADINSALQALASNSAGAAEPSTTYAYQFWYDETNELLKMRNSDNDAWITIGTFDQVADTFTPAGVTSDKIEEGNSSVEVVDTGTGYVAITVDGVEAARVDASGRLGIGDTTPENKLTVVDADGGSGVAVVKARTTTANGRASYQIGNDADNWFMGIDGGNSDAFFISDAIGSNDKLVITQGGNVGIGTSSPARNFHLVGDGTTTPMRVDSGAGASLIDFKDAATTADFTVRVGAVGDNFVAYAGSSERMRIDSSGNLLVGTTNANPASNNVNGFATVGNITEMSRSAGEVLRVNRGNDGDIVKFYRDGSSVGSIAYFSGGFSFSGASPANNVGIQCNGDNIIPTTAGGALSDNAKDLGHPSYRWDDIFATNGTIQTSDRNEKQDIEALSDAEQRVAVAAKGLLRKYRWKNAVAEKGDAARIHFGIIAQDLQAAFEAEGLDAGHYGMFISSTWWEAERVVPAVEAVEAQDAVYETVVIPAEYDEDGNEISPETTEQVLVSEAVEAVEAQPERTVTDTFDTQEEAPEGAVERTRMGVRYPELLAFIIAAI